MKRLIAVGLFLFIPYQTWCAAPPLHKCAEGGFTSQPGSLCSFTPNVAVGNLVVCVTVIQGTTTITGDQDGGTAQTWTHYTTLNGTSNETIISWTVVAGSGFGSCGPTWADSHTGDSGCGEYTNMAAIGTVADCHSAGSSGNSTALTSGSCTPTAANDLIVAGGISMANSLTYTAGGSYTIEGQEAHTSQGNSYGWEDVNATDCTAQTATITASGSAPWSMLMAAFKTSSPTVCAGGGACKMLKMERLSE